MLKFLSRAAGQVAITELSDICLDDWVKAGGTIQFRTGVSEPNRCYMSMAFRGSEVSAAMEAKTTGDAFLRTVAQIEKTIGQEWRTYKK